MKKTCPVPSSTMNAESAPSTVDTVFLQYSNTALSNRLDHLKRELATANLTCHRYASICESYEFFIAQYFSGWKSFLVKLERINLLVKKQDSNERATPKFTAVFESMADLISISNRLKDVADSTASQTAQINTSNPLNLQTIKANMNHAMTELKKITRQRVETFVRMVDNIYTEIAIDCAAANQKVSDTIKGLAANNDINDIMRKLYRENTQLQSKIKEQAKALEAQGSLVEAEKDILLRHFQQETNQIIDLKQRIEEANEINEKLSLRLRFAMDYNRNAIAAKTSAAESDMEEEEDEDDTEQRTAELARVERFECICGGAQIEYYNTKVQELHQARLSAIQNAGLTTGAEGQQIVIMPSATAAEKVLLKKRNSEAGIADAMLSESVLPSGGVALLHSSSSSTLKSSRMSAVEEIAMLKKQKEELVETCGQQERVISELELDKAHLEERFFHSPLYLNLAAQTQELLRSVMSLRGQLRESQKALVEINQLRFKEISELLQKHHEEKTSLMKQANDAREGVYRSSLGDLLAENMTQHFDYKKYTQPLNEQLNKLSESLQLQYKYCRSLEEQKIAAQAAANTQTKTILDLQAKLSEKEQVILQFEGKTGAITTGGETKSSYVDEKTFKYSKHKEILKYVEKMLSEGGSGAHADGGGSSNSTSSSADMYKGFREFVAYVKSREEKVSLVESKLKTIEQDRKRIQSEIDGIWNDYESHDASFVKLKECSDVQKADLKKHADREQELETKNLELMMKFQKEQSSHKIALQSEQLRFETAKTAMEALEEQNRLLVFQVTEGNALIEEMKGLHTAIKADAEDANLALMEMQVQHGLLQKKFTDVTNSHADIVQDYERLKSRLADAYDVLENNEIKEQKSNVKGTSQGNTIEQDKIKNLTQLLQCSCGVRIKDVILHKCLHPFCRQCIEKQVKMRQRICPKCRTPFGMNDIKTLFLSN